MKSGTITDLIIRKAHPNDFTAVSGLLQSLHLPTAGLAEHFSDFLVADSGGATVGSIGLEVYGETALLRSAAVSPELQGNGIGERLYTSLVSFAREHGVRELVLLTTTAEEYFRRRGFEKVAREMIGGPVTASREFKDACPSTATVMRKHLYG